MRHRPPRRRTLPVLAALVVAAAGLPGCSLLGGVDLGVPDVSARYVDVPTATGERSVLVAVPDSLRTGGDADARVPLVVGLHGFGSDAEVMAKISALAAEAGQRGFVAAFGVGLDDSWNAGSCCGTSAAQGVDDVAYLKAAILTVESRYPVDPSKVFVVGYSNGGMLAYRMLCESAELLAGVASVAGTNTTGCAAPTPRPFLQVSGDDDPVVPVNGSTRPTAPGVGPTPAVVTSVQAVADGFGCPRSTRTRVGPVTEVRRAPCRDGVPVVLDLVDGAGHGWPTGEPFSVTGRVLQFFGLA